MELPVILKIEEALDLLLRETGEPWSWPQLLGAVIEHRLPLRAVVPGAARIVMKGWGEQAGLAWPLVGRRLALLLAPHVEDLRNHRETYTRAVALEPGDSGYLTFEEIKARRAILSKVGHTRETWFEAWPDSDWDDGEFMGECDIAEFLEAVHVTEDNCRVPRETMDGLLFILQQSAAAKVARAIETKCQPIRGITKNQARTAFAGLVEINLEKRLGDACGLYGDEGARVQAGSRGGRHPSLWNPVLLALGLNEQNGVALHKLNNAFRDHRFLAVWQDEWREASEKFA
ncbi:MULTISPECIES: hypothetical protein [unclassified Janthinobacterium]|uniref:hypothetical protein n=1 Tax=unclassified Janthinobacterium TaxID=2610881 RepID=UPI000381CD23|nr:MULTISPECIES: hypothetical protein [unclassified Janthinobacterium]MEC5159775.1 hypothetical protein [Janthinobacterium sp. CG_S6]